MWVLQESNTAATMRATQVLETTVLQRWRCATPADTPLCGAAATKASKDTSYGWVSPTWSVRVDETWAWGKAREPVRPLAQVFRWYKTPPESNGLSPPAYQLATDSIRPRSRYPLPAMFTKSALVKFVLAPLAAVTLLAQVASASPTALQRRQDDGFAPDSYHWPPGDDRDCRPDRNRLPNIIKPNRNTVWRIGDKQQVVWEKKRPWDDWKPKNDDDKGRKDGKDGKDGKDDKDKKDGKDHRRPRCKPKLTLRKGRGFRPVTLAENFDLDAGSVGVTVPDVPPDDDYTVTLSLGKLESTSDRFKIVKKRKDCNGWWCKNDDRDHKDRHVDRDFKGGKDGHDKDRHDDKDRDHDKECKGWWCKDHGKDDKDHHDDKDRHDKDHHDDKDRHDKDHHDDKDRHDNDRHDDKNRHDNDRHDRIDKDRHDKDRDHDKDCKGWWCKNDKDGKHGHDDKDGKDRKDDRKHGKDEKDDGRRHGY
ncbi:hypothetical protein LXA43DRAFT_328785 [Ganoderma leucocontextum]|nr:hypothetical protein LXA43DRAFT_328785 [Ganoderma leucocontextum]